MDRRRIVPGPLALPACLLLFAFAMLQCAGVRAEPWPEAVHKVLVTSSADGTEQPVLFYAPPTKGPHPLLVALHTWSSDYQQDISSDYARWSIDHGWVLVHPDFRGPNGRSESTGSERVVADVLDAVAYARQHAEVDPARIYLVGFSGGGYLSLLMAGRAPDLWAGVSAWCPIYDLGAWYFEREHAGDRYPADIATACGGVPVAGSAAARECAKRSAMTYLEHAAAIPLDIHAGIHDGHEGPVPIRHSLRAYNALAAPPDRIAADDIEFLVSAQAVPKHLQSGLPYRPDGAQPVLLRVQSRNVRLTIFEGGHERDVPSALGWLELQHKDHPPAR